MIDLMENDIMRFSVDPTGISYDSNGKKQVVYDLSYSEAAGSIEIGSLYWYNDRETHKYGKHMKWNDESRLWLGSVCSGSYHDLSETYNYDGFFDSLYEYFESEIKKVDEYVVNKYFRELPEAKINKADEECKALTLEVLADNLPNIETTDVLTDVYPLKAHDFEPQSFYSPFISRKCISWEVCERYGVSITLEVDKLVYRNKKYELIGSILIDTVDEGPMFSYYGDLLNSNGGEVACFGDLRCCSEEEYCSCSMARPIIEAYQDELTALFESYANHYSKYIPVETFDNYKALDEDWTPSFTLSLALPDEEVETNKDIKEIKFKELTDDEFFQMLPFDVDV